MRKSLIATTGAIAAIAVAGCGSDDSSDNARTTTSAPAAAPSGAAKSAVDVTISNFKFMPAAVKVSEGGSITWTNEDSAAHTATLSSGAGAFDTGTLNQGDAKKLTFSKPGTYAYICAFHPFMKGTVVVA